MPAGTNPAHERELLPEEPNGRDPKLFTSWKKLAALALIVLALLAVVYLSPLHTYLSHAREVAQQIRSFGAMAPLVLTFGVALLVAIGFPRLALCVIAGMALGFWWGLLWTQLGTLLGNYVSFILIRAGGRDWAQRELARRAPLQRSIQLIQRKGALGIVLARQVPLPGMLINLACALLPVSHIDFILGTLIGQLPQAIPFTLIGAGVLQPSFKKSIILIGLAVVIAVLAWFGLRLALRRIATRKSDCG
jgi:uncharacterized membrane protein YdjX (TVP38/TMEM64 family)